jgi:FAD/FMN-containing dehydrogenase/Fe-S oxidoreductase
VVEPGIALDPLNNQLEPTGWMVGPKPSTHVSCTIGGMIGNNSCGSTAQAYGKMVDSVRRLEVLTYDGTRMWVGGSGDDRSTDTRGDLCADLHAGLRDIVGRYANDIRERFPDIPRRVSGYNLDSLLPENGFDLARFLVGSESTLVTVLRAEIALVRIPAATALAVLGFDDVFAAADAVPAVVRHTPSALEGIDHRLVSLEHSMHLAEKALRQLPDGNAWLMIQFDGEDQDEADKKARDMIDDLREATSHATVIDDPTRKEEVWAAREAGLGATAYPPDGPETHEGWEDAAVPPDRLGEYLREFRKLLDQYDYESSSLYGHFGQGCVHTRIPFQLSSAEGAAAYRRFVTDAAQMVVRYGGSLSGEHGDGQSRGELLSIMFGDRVVTAFEEVKTLFDPGNRMNPGKVVHPRRLDQDLRMGPDYRAAQFKTEFGFVRDDHRFSRAASRCVGVGKCRSHESGVMCPSYRATGEEEHSTRGRARLLFEMLNGQEITDGWRSTDVRDALDLCLACKGCLSDCPVNVDMATYKAEFLSHHYRHRVRPPAHYAMGWIPLWSRIAAVAPSTVNALTHTRGLSSVIKAVGGVDRRRGFPRFADQRFATWWRQHESSNLFPRGRVVLWPDTFTNNFEPDIARDAVTVLHDAGFGVDVPRPLVCCGLTWISTGQLGLAKRVLRRTLDVLRPALRAGTPVVVLEPSCAAVFRSDLPDLLHGDDDAHRLSEQTYTLGQLLRAKAPDWSPPRHGGSAVVQQHCHQHAVLRYKDELKLLDEAGVAADMLDAGCCGLAGNFGFERGHYDVSVACAEDKMLPAIRSRDPDTLVLADGFSCRTQIRELAPDREPRHIAQLLAAAVRRNRNGCPDAGDGRAAVSMADSIVSQ